MSGAAGVRQAPLPILRRALTDGWRGLLGWTVGLAAVALLYLPLFPSMASPELTDVLDALPPALIETLGYRDIGTGPGYTQATFFGLIGFVLSRSRRSAGAPPSSAARRSPAAWS